MHLKKLLIVVFVSTMILSGCWDIVEISDRSIPNALFLDTGNPEKVKMGAVFFVPGSMLPPVVGTTQEFEKRNVVLSAEGRDLTDAWNKLRTVTSRTVFFGQLRAIVISDKYAHLNINNFLDFTGRMPNFPMNIPILITKSDPEKLMDLKNKANIIPGNYINAHLQSPYKKPQTVPSSIGEVFAALDNKTFDPFMTLIEEYQKNYRIAGMAVFSGPRMVGDINLEETETVALIKEIPEGVLITDLGNGGQVSFRDLTSSTKVTPKIDDKGRLTFTIKMNVKGEVSELNPSKREITMQDKKKFEAAAAADIKKNVTELVMKLQRLKSDPLGFGEKFRTAYPRIWKKTNWHEVYSSAKFDVDTKFTIKQTGLFR